LDKNKIKVSENLDIDKNLARAIKYIHKSQYIEASKWLLLANDSKEKYLLLSLINYALNKKTSFTIILKTQKIFPTFTKNILIYIYKNQGSL